MLENKSYSISKNKIKDDNVYLEYDMLDGYQVNPKTSKKDQIKVNKIIFVNDSMSEKIIRKKIDNKINILLKELKDIEDGGGSEEGIKRSLMDAEKLRVQIINNYVKYLGHTYSSLTLKKIQIIVNQLRFKLYTNKLLERQNSMYFEDDERVNGRRGR